MKTLTEFSGVILRQAAKNREDKRSAGLEGEALVEALGADLGMSGDRLARLNEALDAAGDKLDAVRLVRVYEGESAPPRAVTVGSFHYLIDRVSAGKAQDRSRGRPGDRRDQRGGRDGKPRRPGPGRGSAPAAGGQARAERGAGGDRPPRPERSQRADGGRGRGERGDLPREGENWTFTRAGREPGPDRERRDARGPRDDRDRKDRGPRRGPRRDGPRPPRAGGEAAGRPASEQGQPGAPGEQGRPRAPRPERDGGPEHQGDRQGERRRRGRGRPGQAPEPGAGEQAAGREAQPGPQQPRPQQPDTQQPDTQQPGPQQPGAGARRRSRRRRDDRERPAEAAAETTADTGNLVVGNQAEELQPNGNLAEPPPPEVNGNLAVSDASDMDDDIGNR